MMSKGFAIIFAVALALAFAQPAAAEGTDLTKVLLEKGIITQQQYEELQKSAEEKQSQNMDVKVSTDGGIQVSTYDGRFAFKLGGLLAADAAFYREDKNRLGRGTQIRNARLELEGTLYSDWDYEFSFDFADNEVELKDAYMSYKGLDSYAFHFGHFKAPFSMEQLGSRKNLTFMERSLANALVPDRKIGIGASYYANIWTATAGIFGGAADEDVEGEGDESWTSAGRFTLAPIQSDSRVLHFGGSAAFQEPNSARTVRIKTDPESNLTDVTYLNTGKIKNVDDQFTYGIETAIVYGPFSFQGEYIHSSLNLTNSSEKPVFRGGYAFASWVLTGESRRYHFKKGVFSRFKPDSSYGAVELAVRYSTLNLNNSVLSGGRETNLTAALNWYLNPNIRFMTNYVFVNNDSRADDNRDLLANDDPGVFQARVQIDF